NYSYLIDRLKSYSIQVVPFDPQNIQQMVSDLNRLSKILASPIDNQGLVKALEHIKQTREPKLQGKSIYIGLFNDLFTTSDATFIGELVSLLGLQNIVPAHLGPYPKLHWEFILRTNPDYILLTNDALFDLVTRPGWQQLKAYQEQQVCTLNKSETDVLVRPGPRILESFGRLKKCLLTKSPKP
ncbi:MAG: ABC transporter substrate-binding protein, partial [Gammaproteobacteria bacterium]|nr:ABC transporter substrate-binding protein [Gammaproteobacteria bacterium]